MQNIKTILKKFNTVFIKYLSIIRKNLLDSFKL